MSEGFVNSLLDENERLNAENERQRTEIQLQQTEIQRQQTEIQRQQTESQRQQTEIQRQHKEIQLQQTEIQRQQTEIQRLHADNQQLKPENSNISSTCQAQAMALDELKGNTGRQARLGDLVVEVVFPTAGFIRMNDVMVSINEQTMRHLQQAEIPCEEGVSDDLEVEDVFPPDSFFRMFDYKEMLNEGTNRKKRVLRLGLTAGSSAEGVAMQPGWGHPQADEDRMFLYRGVLAVGVDGPGQLPPGGVILMFRDEECPPAYTRLEVVDSDRLSAYINRQRYNKEVPVHKYVQEEGGRQWLMSRRLLDALRDTDDSTVQGPAAAYGPLLECIVALVSTGPHPDMAAYSERTRTGWPTQEQINYLLTLPFIIVCVGPKGHPDTGHLFRVSSSPHEMKLLSDLGLWVRQGYICFKLVMKDLLALFRRPGDDDGRSRVGSYHLKNMLFKHLEEHPPQPEGSPFQLALDLCRNLQQCLLNNNIPNYFLPYCNLLEKVDDRERQDALSAVEELLGDPLAAIIDSPSCPDQIFGSRHSSDDILRCFRAVSDQPACGAARETLQRLLRDLDEHRVGRYDEQLEMDGNDLYRVSWRPGLVRLADHL